MVLNLCLTVRVITVASYDRDKLHVDIEPIPLPSESATCDLVACYFYCVIMGYYFEFCTVDGKCACFLKNTER